MRFHPLIKCEQQTEFALQSLRLANSDRNCVNHCANQEHAGSISSLLCSLDFSALLASLPSSTLRVSALFTSLLFSLLYYSLPFTFQLRSTLRLSTCSTFLSFFSPLFTSLLPSLPCFQTSLLFNSLLVSSLQWSSDFLFFTALLSSLLRSSGFPTLHFSILFTSLLPLLVYFQTSLFLISLLSSLSCFDASLTFSLPFLSCFFIRHVSRYSSLLCSLHFSTGPENEET